jgi:LuxR family maltose regulon positive regulatory protein
MKARIWVKQGRLAEAQNWVLEQDLSINDNLNFLQEYVHITFVRVLFAQYKKNREEELLRQITGLLERLRNSAENGKRIRSIIEILNLQALVSDELGESLQTLKLVEQALTLGKPEGFIRIFVDEGLPMAKLLYEALKQEIEPDYVKRILAAFPLAEPKEYPHLNDLIDQSGLIDPISEREIEVLQLLAKGLTNKVIAERLVLSIHTVKTHTRNIYSKLAVNNRTQAVVKAKSLGILPST